MSYPKEYVKQAFNDARARLREWCASLPDGYVAKRFHSLINVDSEACSIELIDYDQVNDPDYLTEMDNYQALESGMLDFKLYFKYCVRGEGRGIWELFGNDFPCLNTLV